MSQHRFQSKGPYFAFGVRGGLIGEFTTIADAKRACSREELAPCGQWRTEEDTRGVTYYAQGNGCEIAVGRDHAKVAAFSPADIEKATARFRWRESMR